MRSLSLLPALLLGSLALLAPSLSPTAFALAKECVPSEGEMRLPGGGVLKLKIEFSGEQEVLTARMKGMRNKKTFDVLSGPKGFQSVCSWIAVDQESLTFSVMSETSQYAYNPYRVDTQSLGATFQVVKGNILVKQYHRSLEMNTYYNIKGQLPDYAYDTASGTVEASHYKSKPVNFDDLMNEENIVTTRKSIDSSCVVTIEQLSRKQLPSCATIN